MSTTNLDKLLSSVVNNNTIDTNNITGNTVNTNVTIYNNGESKKENTQPINDGDNRQIFITKTTKKGKKNRQIFITKTTKKGKKISITVGFLPPFQKWLKFQKSGLPMETLVKIYNDLCEVFKEEVKPLDELGFDLTGRVVYPNGRPKAIENDDEEDSIF